MDFQALMHNQLVVFGGIGFVLTVLGVLVSHKKLFQIGVQLSSRLTKLVGKKNAETIENDLQAILDGMKADNEGKK